MSSLASRLGAVLVLVGLVHATALAAPAPPKAHAERARLNAALVQVCREGDLARTKLLLRQGANVNGRDDGHDRDGETPLMAAAWRGSVPVVRLLLRHHALVDLGNIWDVDHASALAAAADQGSIAIVRLLLAHGADVNTTVRFGSALTKAVENGNLQMVRLLLAHGADPDVGTYRSPLVAHIAAKGDARIVRAAARGRACAAHGAR